MFHTIKNYFTRRRENKELLRTALLTLINDSGNFYRVQTKILETAQRMNDVIRPEEMKDFMDSMNEFVNNHELNEDFYSQIVRHGRKERAGESES